MPSSRTTTCSISSAGTSAGQYTPYAWAGPGGFVVKNPGMLARASSIADDENARPTARSSGAFADTCSRPLERSWSGPSAVTGTNRVSIVTPASRRC